MLLNVFCSLISELRIRQLSSSTNWNFHRNTNCLISFHKEPIFFSILGILSETVSSLHIWFNLQFETFLILFYKKKEENVQELNFNAVTLIAFEFHTCTYYLLSEQCTQ